MIITAGFRKQSFLKNKIKFKLWLARISLNRDLHG